MEQTYADFGKKRARLIALLEQQKAAAVRIEGTSWASALDRLRLRVEDEGFRVLVLGEFKRGKSTLINAMLGSRVMPAAAVPTTAVISEVKYDERAHAVLFPRESEQGRAPFEVDVDALSQYVVIDDANPTAESPYEKVDIYWPLDLCRDGVNIVDSPGLDDEELRDKVTLGYLARADAIVFVLNITQPLSRSEANYLRDFVVPLGHEEIFFVYNRFDEIEPNERERTRRVGRQRLADTALRMGLDESRIRVYFIDSRGALRSRLENAAKGVAETGLPEFEADLQGFLTGDRGRIKLLVPLREMRYNAARCLEATRERAELLDTERTELLRRYEAAQVPLMLLEKRRAQIATSTHVSIDGIVSDVEDNVLRFTKDVAAKAEQWAIEAKPTGRLSLNLFRTKRQVTAVTEELCAIVGDHVQNATREWQAESLRPLLDKRSADLEAELDRDLEKFLDQLDATRIDLSGGERSVIVDADHGSPFERVLAGTAGVLLMDVGLGYTGARFGAKSMLKAAGVQAAIAGVGIAMGLSGVGLIVLLLGASAIQNLNRLDQLNEDLKRRVGAQLRLELDRLAPDRARAFARSVGDGLRSVVREVDSAMAQEIASAREQIEAAIRDKQGGDERVRQQRANLREVESQIQAINEARDALLEEVAVGVASTTIGSNRSDLGADLGPPL